MITTDDIKLVLTCSACPEQYDAFYKGMQCGYLRLRHGCFRVDCPDCGDITVYESEDMIGDGEFFDDMERAQFTTIAKEKIVEWLNNDVNMSKLVMKAF